MMLQSKGSRPLIFSQWTSVLDILGWLLKTMGLPHVRLDGSTVVAERLSTVDRSVPHPPYTPCPCAETFLYCCSSFCCTRKLGKLLLCHSRLCSVVLHLLQTGICFCQIVCTTPGAVVASKLVLACHLVPLLGPSKQICHPALSVYS